MVGFENNKLSENSQWYVIIRSRTFEIYYVANRQSNTNLQKHFYRKCFWKIEESQV